MAEDLEQCHSCHTSLKLLDIFFGCEVSFTHQSVHDFWRTEKAGSMMCTLFTTSWSCHSTSQRFKSRLPLTQLWIQIETRLKNCTGCGKAYCRVSAEPHFPSSALWNYFEPRDYFHLVTIIAKHLVEAMWRSHEDIQEAKSQHPWHYSESPSQAPISWPCRAGATACNLCLQHQLPLFTRLVDTPIKLIERIQEGHLGEHHFPKPIGSRHLKFHVQKHSDWQYHTRKKKQTKPQNIRLRWCSFFGVYASVTVSVLVSPSIHWRVYKTQASSGWEPNKPVRLHQSQWLQDITNLSSPRWLWRKSLRRIRGVWA